MQVSVLILAIIEFQIVSCAPVFEFLISKVAPNVAEIAPKVAEVASQSMELKPAEFIIPAKKYTTTVRFRGTGVADHLAGPPFVADPPAPVVNAGRFVDQAIVNHVDGEVLGSEIVPVWSKVVKEKHI